MISGVCGTRHHKCHKYADEKNDYAGVGAESENTGLARQGDETAELHGNLLVVGCLQSPEC
jgi:hypothetical protein